MNVERKNRDISIILIQEMNNVCKNALLGPNLIRNPLPGKVVGHMWLVTEAIQQIRCKTNDPL